MEILCFRTQLSHILMENKLFELLRKVLTLNFLVFYVYGDDDYDKTTKILREANKKKKKENLLIQIYVFVRP